MLAEADVHAVSFDGHAGEEVVPFVAPCVAVVMAAEKGEEAGGGSDRVHEWYVLTTVVAGPVVRAVGTVALCLLREGVVVVYSGLVVWIDACLCLEGLGGVCGNMDECQAGDRSVVSGCEALVGSFEPVDDALIYPVRLADFGACGIALLVKESAARVKGPKDEAWNIPTVVRVDREVVITHASIRGIHIGARQGVGVALFAG